LFVIAYTPHPIADIFPMISGKEFVDLKADIKANGCHEPVVLYEGRILDGRNRFKACQEVGVEPKFIEYQGSDPIGFVISLNLHRRHLSSDQRAAAAVNTLPLYEAEAKKRQAAAGGDKKSDAAKSVSQKIEQPISENSRKASQQVAEQFNTNRQYVSDMKKLREEDPDAFESIKQGERKLQDVKREKKEQQREQARDENRAKIALAKAPEKLTGVYSTIVIDPPWDWGDEGDKDQLGRARPDYSTMSIEQLLALPVGSLADSDAHLYLWITNRSLPKGFALMESWGFRYITALTWVKPHFGMGNYFRGQTEQVLFGVKGSLPLKRRDQGTVFHADRGPNGHSSKPPEFYDLVESCSPGPYLEMFSRTGRADWVHWGENANAA
jgi:N6-adenosine-specific RNA methylase IME4